MLYLYELRESGEYYDLLIQFKDVPNKVLHSRVEELKNKKWIDVHYPFYGGFIINTRTGTTTDFGGGKDYLKARIKADGIDHVKNQILTREKIDKQTTVSS